MRLLVSYCLDYINFASGVLAYRKSKQKRYSTQYKKGVGCSHAMYSVRNIVDGFVYAKSTVNVCALDLSKAFDKVNHHALFIKLMKKYFDSPVETT